jgi:hypothetical protein
MRIVEQTEGVLILRSSAKYFWFETIFLLSGSLACILSILFVVPYFLDGWVRLLILFLLLFVFCMGLQQAWSSDDLKSCSFDKVLNRISIDYHGLKHTTANFSLEEMQALDVRETAQAHYGVIHKWSQLWLVTRSERFLLSDTQAEEIADRVREFLLPIERSI